ncbi:hypothetical protein JQ581_02465 [Bradyrhizobium liaoningense]|uniref:hypothetical protein n=1 Tax=Bradyrhizobium liaoningense TaxID=43992 RepID=UPI001BA5DF4A|nr:hypothetical protein [Bradyrhizobium liaoningense]MBR0735778.1 hypothetical protein [Bradyrhizobium liaoningense]
MGIWDALASVAKDRTHPAAGAVEVFAVIVFTFGGMAAFMVFPFMMAAIVGTGGDIMSGKAPVQALWRNCYDFKEIDGKVFRIDQCRGKLEPYVPEKPKTEDQ